MKPQIFTIKKHGSFIRIISACFLILAAGSALFAQYKGAPVKKGRLVQALRSRQLQTQDIVAIINKNGVDFRLTAEIKQALVAAGARPEVIKAVSNNSRLPAKNESAAAKTEKNITRRNKSAPANYEDLLDQAMYSYNNEKNSKGAIRILETAAKINPNKPEAHQMLGFVHLYGLKNFTQAEKSMRDSFANGGSAVFRVYHDDNGKFTSRCSGSLYISQDNMRFESDNNVHTFETTIVNVDKIKLDTESTGVWKKHSVFKIFLKIGKDKAKFRFAPVTGVSEESKMVARFIAASNSNKNPTVSAVTFSH